MKYFKPINWQTVNEPQFARFEDELRHRLVATFVKDNQNRFSEITQALNSGDVTLAHRLTHTLRGNAGHFGKMLLQKAAADVEVQLKDGQNMAAPEQLAVLETELKAALIEFAAELATTDGITVEEKAETKAAAVDKLIDEESVIKVFAKLRIMLEMGSLECRDYIDILQTMPGTEKLIRQIEDLDFEQALVTLGSLQEPA